MTRVLVTGFEPFGAHATNPSGDVALALDGIPGVSSVVLPVSYERSRARLAAEVEAVRADAVIVLGLCARSSAIRLERIALNLDDSAQPDSDGDLREGSRIVADGPPAYWSTLPLGALAAHLRAGGVPVEWSRDAGGYVCNHVFYLARHLIESRGGSDVPCGLVHVPPFANVPRDAQVEVVRTCIDLGGRRA